MKESLLSVIFITLFSSILGMAQQDSCKSDGFPLTEQFLVGENIDYLVPNSSAAVGYLVIVPQMKFDCHGYITGWSALTWLNSNDAAIEHLSHDIIFQLWRPSVTESGVYTFIGSQKLDFSSSNLRSGLSVIDGLQFFNFTDQAGGEMLTFQPGDVIGWYIHTLVQSTEQPLSVVYRTPANDPNSQPVDMYRVVITDTDAIDTPPPCDIALCSSQATLISSVIPYVTVEYGKQS